MTKDDIVQFKLALAQAWLENGQEELARSIVKSIIDPVKDTTK